jgi:hypothetical protein
VSHRRGVGQAPALPAKIDFYRSLGFAVTAEWRVAGAGRHSGRCSGRRMFHLLACNFLMKKRYRHSTWT